jgi:outer membrane protein TolC
MNLRPGQAFELSAPADFVEPKLDVAPREMEEIALLHRPELIEASYKERIGLDETHKALAKLLPGVELQLGGHYDSNSFLVNNKWGDAGFQISWNILNLFNAHNVKAAAKAQYDLAREQRLALNMAVLTQVHVAWLDYNGRMEQFQLTRRLNDVEQRILEHTHNAAENSAESHLTEIRAATSALMADLRRYQSYAALQGAYGQMLTSLGLDPVPAAVASHDLGALETAIHDSQQRWQMTAPSSSAKVSGS